MTVVDTWLQGGEILAHLHAPDAARSAAGVVICPPIGQENIVAYRTLRLLAERASANGIAAIRFDYPGFGDSTAAPTPGSLVAGSIAAANALRSTGVTRIVYLGLASGALVAAAAAGADPDASGLVLWDPPQSGRRWLRRQRSLYSLAVHSPSPVPDGSERADAVAIAGADLTPAVAEAISRFGYDGSLANRMPVLVARRRGESPTDSFDGRPTVTDLEVDGHESLLDVSSISARIPGSSVEAVVAWLTATFGAVSPVRSQPIGASSLAIFPHTPRHGGAAVALAETLVRVGPDRLFAIETAPLAADGSAPDDSLPAMVLHNGSSEHRIGANRYQVELARELAARGIRTLRVDRRGTGESGPVSAGEQNLLFTKAWVADGENAARHLGLPADRVGVVGMCVGAWLGLVTDPGLAALAIAISPNDYRGRPAEPEEIADLERAAHTGAPDADASPSLKRRATSALKNLLGYRALLLIARAGKLQLVEPLLRAPLDRGSRVVLFLGPQDGAIFDDRHGERALARLRNSSGSVQVIRHPTGDHSLFDQGIRNRAIDVVVAEAAAHFRPLPAGVSVAEPSR